MSEEIRPGERVPRADALGHREESHMLREHGGGAKETIQNSLALALQSAQEFIDAHNLAHAAESRANAVLALLRLSRITGERQYIDDAIAQGEQSVKEAVDSHQNTAVAVPTHTLAKAYRDRAVTQTAQGEKINDLVKAKDLFLEATQLPLPRDHAYRLYQKELWAHVTTTILALAIAEGRSTDFEEQMVRQAIASIAEEQEQQTIQDTAGHFTKIDRSYEKMVWLSGVNKRYSVLLNQLGRPEEAGQYQQEAERVLEEYEKRSDAKDSALRRADIIGRQE